MSRELDGQTLASLVPGFVAPAVELLVNAVTPPPVAPTLLAGHHAALMLSAFQSRYPKARYFLMEAIPPPALRGVEGNLRAMYGRTYPLPVRTSVVGAAVHGLCFVDSSGDGPLLRETARSLQPGGTLVATYLMRGSFDAFLDAAREACESQGLRDVMGSLVDMEGLFRTPAELEAAASRAGLVDVELGMEERGMPYANARAFLADPAVGWLVLRHLRSSEDRKSRLLDEVAGALDTYFSGLGLTARVVTGVLRGVKP
ncbi:MAG: hypothetical protein AB2A00_23330 [Myxococcota bacterium]